ncbi:MAG: MbnP family protein [Limisphaerales bacterium]
MRRHFPLFALLFGLGSSSFVHATKLQIDFAPYWRGRPLAIGKLLEAEVSGLSVTRVDWLLSELALKRTNGSWVAAPEWSALLSAGKQRLSVVVDGLPPEEFTAARFRVGLPAKEDEADPQQWEPGHPLHPDVNGLHWGWTGGYVFLAIEGHREMGDGKVDGFSYHLAGAAEPMIVELPVEFSGARPNTLRVALDLAELLKQGATLKEATSTHSREGDKLAVELKRRVAKSFRLLGVETDLFQASESPREVKVSSDSYGGGTPFRLAISERLPKVKLPPDNPLTVEGVALGRELFHDARLSKGNVQSCASCHDVRKSFSDGKRFSTGSSGVSGRRNAMPLVNLAWADGFFWDGRSKSLREQVLMPIQDAHEMNESLGAVEAKLAADAASRRKFAAAFGSTEVTSERIALALEQFLLTLVSQDSKFDRAARKLTELTTQEKRGLQLFVTEHDPARELRGADCFHCHGGNLFSNHQFMNNGLKELGNDLGGMEVTGLATDRGKFKVPTLRNVAVTGPYMHDGRFSTLEEVVEHYNSGVQRSRTLDPNLAKHPNEGLRLSEEDKQALVAFLRTLTDESFIRTEQRQFSQAQ